MLAMTADRMNSIKRASRALLVFFIFISVISIWSALQILAGAAVSLKVLYHLIRLVALYARGRLFTTESVAQIRQVGVTYALALVVWLIPLIGAAQEIAAEPEQWTSIMPSFPGGALIAACLFLFASGIMDEGRKLREDQELTV
jgi:hypothetical protein